MVYKVDLCDDLFKEKVGAISPKDVARLARERGGGTLAVVEVLLTEYNKRMIYLTHKLDEVLKEKGRL